MSGGHFQNHTFSDIVDEVERLIKNNKRKDEYGYKNNYSKKTLDKFKQAVRCFKVAQICLHRIDYLVSGDDGEETFHKLLEEEIKLCFK